MAAPGWGPRGGPCPSRLHFAMGSSVDRSMYLISPTARVRPQPQSASSFYFSSNFPSEV